jgi:hypothetical protein
MITRKARDRAYHVLMYGISEENRIMQLSREELLRRQKDAWDSAYGDMTEAQLEKASRDRHSH